MAYPVNVDTMLVNSITSNCNVQLVGGMQVATITFTTPAGLLGTVTLSPVQPTATNLEFKAGQQVLQISNITFRAAFGFDKGQVTIAGTGTDQNGNDPAAFNKQIGTWSN
jgi:hypothetical protein